MTNVLTILNKRFVYDEIEESRKSFALTVFPTGKILFKTPQKASFEERCSFLQKKMGWIEKQKEFFQKITLKEQTFVSGSDLLYLGRRYQLIIKKQCPERVSFANNKIFVYAKTDAIKNLQDFMRSRAERVFTECLNECLKLFPEISSSHLQLKVRKMSKRWGSYQSNGVIMLNPELIKAPKKCIRYVIIHELCHKTHKAHNRAFFNLLAQKLPNYKALKMELELGYGAIHLFSK